MNAPIARIGAEPTLLQVEQEARFAAIPTMYAGVLFRSRLEARYACLFDTLGWAWSYEPTDFSGWIPDFRLMGDTDLLVEVKPIRSILEDKGHEAVMDVWRSAPADAHVVLLGDDIAAWLREPGHPVPDVAPGALDPWRVGWGEACIGKIGDAYDVWHFWGSPQPLLNSAGGIGARLTGDELAALWRKTNNPTQWRAPHAR